MSYVLGSQKEITIYTQNKTKFQKEKSYENIGMYESKGCLSVNI